MAKTFVKKLQEKIEQLEDSYDIKNVELALLENELQETKEGPALLMQQSSILIEMFEEVFNYHKKKPSERSKASMERLMKLMDINNRLQSKVSYNAYLQAINKDMFGRIQVLRVEKADLNRQLTNLNNSAQF